MVNLEAQRNQLQQLYLVQNERYFELYGKNKLDNKNMAYWAERKVANAGLYCIGLVQKQGMIFQPLFLFHLTEYPNQPCLFTF